LLVFPDSRSFALSLGLYANPIDVDPG
jgi:hypothetical protein